MKLVMEAVKGKWKWLRRQSDTLEDIYHFYSFSFSIVLQLLAQRCRYSFVWSASKNVRKEKRSELKDTDSQT